MIKLSAVVALVALLAQGDADEKKPELMVEKGTVWEYCLTSAPKSQTPDKIEVVEAEKGGTAKVTYTDGSGKTSAVACKTEDGFLILDTPLWRNWKFFKPGVKKGDSWISLEPLGPNEACRIESIVSATAEDVQTLAGKFKDCTKIFHILQKGDQRVPQEKITIWWAEGVGVVAASRWIKDDPKIALWVLKSHKPAVGKN